MNSIIEHQNDQSILDKLSAQSRLYNKSKQLRGVRFILGVVVIVGLSVSRIIWYNEAWIETAMVLVTAIALIAEPWLENLIGKRRTLAAQIQQRVDNQLYGFDWDECVCGKEPSDEIVCDYKGEKPDKSLLNWYDKGIGNVDDLHMAILLCQRENVSYDSGLRSWYVSFCAWAACFLVLAVLVLSLVKEWDLMRFLIFGVIPAIPVAEWFITIFQDNASDKEHLADLEELMSEEIDKAIKGNAVTKTTLQKIQNLLFLHRKSGYLIPRWFYECKRSKSEARAAYSIQEFLKKIQPPCGGCV